MRWFLWLFNYFFVLCCICFLYDFFVLFCICFFMISLLFVVFVFLLFLCSLLYLFFLWSLCSLLYLIFMISLFFVVFVFQNDFFGLWVNFNFLLFFEKSLLLDRTISGNYVRSSSIHTQLTKITKFIRAGYNWELYKIFQFHCSAGKKVVFCYEFISSLMI